MPLRNQSQMPKLKSELFKNLFEITPVIAHAHTIRLEMAVIVEEEVLTVNLVDTLQNAMLVILPSKKYKLGEHIEKIASVLISMQ